MIANVIVSSSPTSGIFFECQKFWKNLVNIVYVPVPLLKVKVILKKKQTMRKYNHSENIRLYSNI